MGILLNIAPPTPKKNPDNINIPGVCACPKKKIGNNNITILLVRNGYSFVVLLYYYFLSSF
jgi:hypothetical protein